MIPNSGGEAALVFGYLPNVDNVSEHNLKEAEKAPQNLSSSRIPPHHASGKLPKRPTCLPIDNLV